MQIDLRSRPARGPAQWVTQWLISATSLALVVQLVPGVRLDAGGWRAAVSVLAASAILGLLNLLLKPVLILITLPVNIMTLGLFTLVINGIVLQAAAAAIPGLSIEGFWTAVWAAFVLSLFTLLLNALLGGSALSVRVGRR